MLKKGLIVLGISVACMGVFIACTKKTPTTEQATEKASSTTPDDTPDGTSNQQVSSTTESVTTTKEKESTTTEVPIATKEDEAKAPKKATVIYQGFADDNSIEVECKDGSYLVLLVENESLIKKLEQMEPNTTINIAYQAKAGQANKRLIRID